MTYSVAKVVAEIGALHLGSMERAKDLIDLAKVCGADYVKFQKRNPDESVPEEIKNKPHPNQMFAYGNTYLEHRKALELSIEQHKELSQYCEQLRIAYACSVWDKTSADEILALKPAFIKIPSALNNNQNLISHIMRNFDGDLHVSLGMTTADDKFGIIKFLTNWPYRVVIYHCTSIYPCPFDKLNLLGIEDLCSLKRMGMRIGFSNHGYGIAADIAAWVLGAEYIERHFTDDRTLRHTDAAASLEPDGLRKLCRDLKNLGKAMTHPPRDMYTEENEQLKKMRI